MTPADHEEMRSTMRETLSEMVGRPHDQPAKVGLDLKTWSMLIGMSVAILGIIVGIMMYVFRTNNDAITEKAEIQREAVQQHITIVETFNEVISATLEKHSAAPHPATTTQLHKLDKKIDAIGIRVGAGRAIRKIDEDNGD